MKAKTERIINNKTKKSSEFPRIRNLVVPGVSDYLVLKEIYICTGSHKTWKLLERTHFPDIL